MDNIIINKHHNDFLETYDYKNKKLIGTGSNGSRVFLLKHKTTQEEIALKKIIITPTTKLNAANLDMLIKLSHPHIIKFLSTIQLKDKLLLVMEYAKEGDLKELISQHKANNEPFPEESIMLFFAQIISAVQYLHNVKKIIHRDIKPGNIFMTSLTNCKLGDFDIAKELIQHDFALTNCGTPFYLSPEICNGSKYDYKTDIWTLGCLLYELCTLDKPFNSKNIKELLDMIMYREYKPIEGLEKRYDEAIVNVIKQCLQKDPNARPSVNDIKKMLSNVTSFMENYKLIKGNKDLVIDTTHDDDDVNGDGYDYEIIIKTKGNDNQKKGVTKEVYQYYNNNNSYSNNNKPSSYNDNLKSPHSPGVKFLCKLFKGKENDNDNLISPVGKKKIKQSNSRCSISPYTNRISPINHLLSSNIQSSKKLVNLKKKSRATSSLHSPLFKHKEDITSFDASPMTIRYLGSNTKKATTTAYYDKTAVNFTKVTQASFFGGKHLFNQSKPKSTKGKHKMNFNEDAMCDNYKLKVAGNYFIRRYGRNQYNQIKDILRNMTNRTKQNDMLIIKRIIGDEQEFTSSLSYLNYLKEHMYK